MTTTQDPTNRYLPMRVYGKPPRRTWQLFTTSSPLIFVQGAVSVFAWTTAPTHVYFCLHWRMIKRLLAASYFLFVNQSRQKLKSQQWNLYEVLCFFNDTRT